MLLLLLLRSLLLLLLLLLTLLLLLLPLLLVVVVVVVFEADAIVAVSISPHDRFLPTLFLSLVVLFRSLSLYYQLFIFALVAPSLASHGLPLLLSALALSFTLVALSTIILSLLTSSLSLSLPLIYCVR